MTTKLVIEQPAPVMESKVSDNQWSTGICGCCQDIGQCCCLFWCCPCFACKTTRDYGQCMCLPLLDPCGGFIPAASFATRVSMRQRYGIEDTICQDCLYATFCLPCSWGQMATEIQRRAIPITLISAKPKP